MRRIIMAGAGLAWSVSAQTIDPALFRHWAGNNVKIVDTYRHYQEEFREKRRKRYDSSTRSLENRPQAFLILVDFEAVQPMTDSGSLVAILPTNEGDFTSILQKSYGAVHVGYLAGEAEYGGYLIIDELSLSIERADAPGKEYLFKGLGEDMAFGPSSGYLLPAVFWRNRSVEVNAGFLVRNTPKLIDSAGREVFYFQKLSDDTYEPNDFSAQLFLDGRWRGFALNTLLRLGDLEYLGFSFDPLEGGGLDVLPFLRYNRYRSRFQAGAILRKAFREHYSARLEAANDVHRDLHGDLGYYYHVDLEARRVFGKLPRSRLSEFTGWDFHLALEYGISASTDMLDAFAFGTSARIAFEDILGLATLRVGAGVNDYDYLAEFPIRNTFILDLNFQVAY